MIVHTHVLFIDELNGIESTYIIDKYTTDSPDVVQGALSIMTLVYPAGNKPTTFTGPNELLHVTCTLTSRKIETSSQESKRTCNSLWRIWSVVASDLPVKSVAWKWWQLLLQMTCRKWGEDVSKKCLKSSFFHLKMIIEDSSTKRDS